jgi:predicted MFS family arabinose efflux permease
LNPPDELAPGAARAIVLLAMASFASQSMVRVTDSILPQIAADLGTSVGEASIVVAGYGFAHGTAQLLIGPVGDRFGKFVTIAVSCAASAVLVILTGLADTLPHLILARFATGLAAGSIIPLSMAFVGDVTPYALRQQVLGRFLSGGIMGHIFGQVVGGVFGEMFGWRLVFFVLGSAFVVTAVLLFAELSRSPITRAALPANAGKPSGMFSEYKAVLGDPWARFVIGIATLECAAMWGMFAYIGADLHLRFGLSFSTIGLFVAVFGIGGLAYALFVKRLLLRLGQPGLAIGGGAVLSIAFLTLASGWAWWLAPIAIAAIGFGFYMLHNTLQTNATQMSPQARGTAVAIFAAGLFIGQGTGTAIAAPIVDRFGAGPIFLASAIILPALAAVFARALSRRARA